MKKVLDLHNKIIGNLKLLVGDEDDCENTKPVYISRRYFAKIKKSGMMKAGYKMIGIRGNLIFKDTSISTASPVYRTVNFTRVRDSARALLKVLEKMASATYILPVSFKLFYDKYIGFHFQKTSIRYMPIQGVLPWEDDLNILVINVCNISVVIEYEQLSRRYYAVDIVLHPFSFATDRVVKCFKVYRLLSREKILMTL